MTFCSITVTRAERAEQVMGRNFIGVADAVRSFQVCPSRLDLIALRDVPWDEDVLTELCESHLLVAVLPISILEIRSRVEYKLFHSHEGAWYETEPLAQQREPPGWHL